MLLGLVSCSVNSSQEFYRYIAPLENEVIVVVPEERMVINGPYGDEVHFCDDTSDYLCVQHPIFWLAIPRKVQSLKDGDEWEYNNAQYKLLAKFENYKFKRFKSKSAYIVKGINEDGDNIYFVYTTEFGVIYRESDKSTAFGTLILDGDVGFGW